jgi:thiamine biosynthesis lipoprotein
VSSGSPSTEYERRFKVFGTQCRILIGSSAASGARSPQFVALGLEALLGGMHRVLTRFDPDSELSRMNASAKTRVPVSDTLAMAVWAGLWAAERSGGLVDPTLAPEIEAAGYTSSLEEAAPVPLREALASASRRPPARPHTDARWRLIALAQDARAVVRPPGVRFDPGGTSKGLAADICALRAERHDSFAIDLGGDVVVGGRNAAPRRVEIEHPWEERTAHVLRISHGAVATSGLSRRVWSAPGGFAHHLLDPATGRPAWTGLVQATALADTALAAEVLAKAALLSGPDRARALLCERGGVLVLDDGRVEALGPARDAIPAMGAAA